MAAGNSRSGEIIATESLKSKLIENNDAGSRTAPSEDGLETRWTGNVGADNKRGASN